MYLAIANSGSWVEPTTLKDVVTSKNNVVTCRIGGADLDAIDALVEAGIRTTRSDAAAWLIHAGVNANKDLLEKVYGTVAEIRRLRVVAQNLAQQGLENGEPAKSQEKKPAEQEK